MTNDTVIHVKDISKTFLLPLQKNSSVKSAVINFSSKKKRFVDQQALQKVSFDIKQGEFFGIVGRNGSGKSTLLKMLAGIYAPTTGEVAINGKLTPFIELGVGFNPELTGRENVFLNGALLGFSRAEMNEMYDDIVDFAELEKFMDQKLKNYSSGMQVRLAFSIAIRAQTDILLIDEVLAVGDAAFQKKCFEHFMHLKKTNTTVILVTHDMAAVERFCDRVLVIDKSKSLGIMSPGEAATLYSKLNSDNQGKSAQESEQNRWGTGKVTFESIELSSGREKSREKKLTVSSGKPLKLTIKTKAQTDQDIVIGLAFVDQFGINISGPNSIGEPIKANQTVTYTIDTLPFSRGEYSLTAALFDKDVIEEYDHIEQAAKIAVVSPTEIHGKINLYGSWS